MPLVVNPFTKVSKPIDSRPRTQRLKASELTAICNTLSQCHNPLVKQVFLFALAAGMRRGEVLSLIWHNVDWIKSTALLPMTKNGDRRMVPLGPEAVRVISDCRERMIACSKFIGPVHLNGHVFPIPSERELESRFDRFGHPLCQQNLGTLSFKREVSGRAFEELNKICYGIFSAVIIDDDMVKLDVFCRQVGAIQPR